MELPAAHHKQTGGAGCWGVFFAGHPSTGQMTRIPLFYFLQE